MDLTLCLTHDCNLDCAYCYAGDKLKRRMTREVADTAIDLVFQEPSTEMQLSFFGGEPLLEWDLLRHATDRVMREAGRSGVILKKTVTTNATLLDRDKVDWLADREFYPALSIDGNRAMHNITRPLRGGESSFDQCMNGLRAAKTAFPEIEVIVVPDPANVHHMIDGVRYLVEEEDVQRVSINPNFYTEWSDSALDEWTRQFEALGDFYLERYRAGKAFALNFIDGKIITRLKNGFECRDRCTFGETEVVVAASGRLYPCERVVGSDDNDELCIGTVRDGIDMAKRASILKQRGNVNPECSDCSVKHRCMNWCCCINYALTGRIDRTDGIVCFHERLAIKVADRVGGELYEEANPLFLQRFYYEDFSDAEELIGKPDDRDNSLTPTNSAT